MLDPSLYDKMHLNSSSVVKTAKEDALDPAIEEIVKEAVDALMKEEEPSKNGLLSPEARRKKLEFEVRETLDFTEFGQHISTAVNILLKEGMQYLSEEEYDVLIESLDHLCNELGNLDLIHLEEEKLKSAFQIPSESCASILKIGIAKYSENFLPESLSIFSFLASLDHENPDYLYRLGLIALESKRYNLALRAFAAVLELAPEFIGARIFTAQCYLDSDQREKVPLELIEIKSVLKTKEDEENWGKHVLAIEEMLANPNLKGG